MIALQKEEPGVRKVRGHYQGCELELELEELGNFGRTRTRTRKRKIFELKLELELEKSLWSLSSFNE